MNMVLGIVSNCWKMQLDQGVSLEALIDEVGANGIVSLENSFHPWPGLCELIDHTREHLEQRRGCLKLCFDACNLVNQLDDSSTQRFPPQIQQDDLAMIHLKQTSAEQPLPDVTAGDVDWALQFDTISRLGYEGPMLFEIDPREEIWENLERSIDYLRRLGGLGASD